MTKGFTLVEILVVIAIMTIIGVLAYANFSNLKSDRDLKSAASDVQSFLRLAQSNSTARVRCGEDTTGSGANWLVEFRTNKINADLKCQIASFPPPDPTLHKTLTISNGITIDSIIGDSSCVAGFPVILTFAPLYGDVSFSDTGVPNCNTSSKLTINLKDPKDNLRSVIISKGGSVDIQ